MELTDLELCQRIKDGDDFAFEELQARYSTQMRQICKKEFESGKGGIHKKMRINYNDLVEDVSMIAWFGLYNAIKKEDTKFEGKDAFVRLLTRVTQNKTKDLKLKSIKNRTKSVILGGSNEFESIDQREDDYQTETPTMAQLLDLGRIEEGHFYELLAEQLTAKEKEVFELMVNGLEEGKALTQGAEESKLPTQNAIAEKLGITDRTVRNRMAGIQDKAKLLLQELTP